MNILGFFQRLGRALQLPIAVLPVAALLLRFGQPDLLNVAFIAQAGGAIFDNLALIFAIGVASSWSKDSAGAAALAGAVKILHDRRMEKEATAQAERAKTINLGSSAKFQEFYMEYMMFDE